MRSIRRLPDGGVVAPVRGRRVPGLGRRALARRRPGFSGLSRLAIRSAVALLAFVLVVVTIAFFAPTAALYLGLALVVLTLPVVVPYLVVRGVVAVVDR